MVSTWMGDHSSVEVEAVVENTVKQFNEQRNGASKKYSQGPKNIKIKNIKTNTRCQFYSGFEFNCYSLVSPCIFFCSWRTCSSYWSAVSLIRFTSRSQRSARAEALAVSLARLCIFFLIESILVAGGGDLLQASSEKLRRRMA